eukprot:gene26348-34983_t
MKLEELKQKVEFIFSDNSMDRERIMRIASATDNGFVGIDFLLIIPQIRAMTTEMNDILEAVENSEYLIVHNNRKKLKRHCSFRYPDAPYYSKISPFGNTFLEAIKISRYITAKELWNSGRCGVDIERAKVEVIRKLTFELNNTLYKLLHYKTLYALLRELNEEKSYMLLLWTAFPRLLMMFPDMIHPPLEFERPYWDWGELLNSIHQLNGTMMDAYTELPQEDYSHSPGVICTFYGVTTVKGARILATLFCSPRVIVVHDRNGMVWIKDIFLSGPRTTSHHRTTYRIVPPSEQEEYATKQQQQQYRQGQVRRSITADDLTYLRQLPPPICNRTYINWEFYCRELLESIERLSGSLVGQVIELEDTDYPLQEGVLCTYYGINGEGARQLASGLCSSRIIVVYDKALTALYIKDITLSGPQKLAYFRTTYRIAPSPPQSSTIELEEEPIAQLMPQQERLRTITDNELAYLKQLRWQDRRPALLVAARYRNGIYFHVLKLVAMFL